jgi:S1-C subfamily serine protease
MVEAHAAEIITNDGRKIAANIVGYDHDTGFGLLQAVSPLKLRAMTFGKSADLKVGEPVLASSFGGRDGTVPAFIAARREFAGSWEYLIDGAIFTTPAHSHWSGAALINREGKLVGVGSLIVGDVGGKHAGVAGNMYVPIDLLPPILADLIADGRAGNAPKPWIGVNTEEVNGKLVVSRITPGSPAEKFGMKRGDVIVSIGGQTPSGLADMYRKIWSRGEAGVDVPIDFERDGGKQHLDIKSMIIGASQGCVTLSPRRPEALSKRAMRQWPSFCAKTTRPWRFSWSRRNSTSVRCRSRSSSTLRAVT